MLAGRALSVLVWVVVGGAVAAHAQDGTAQHETEAPRRAALERDLQSEAFALQLRQSQLRQSQLRDEGGAERRRVEALPADERQRLDLQRDAQRPGADPAQSGTRTWTPTLERPPRQWTPSLQ